MQEFVTELVTLKPESIVGHTMPVVKLLLQATRTVPIVFVAVTDPVGSKIVANRMRPGGNITGFSITSNTMPGKYLSILRMLVPQLSRAAVTYDPDQSSVETFFLRPFMDVARQYKVEPITMQVQNPAEVESSIAQLASEPATGLIVLHADDVRSGPRRSFVPAKHLGADA